MIDGFPISILLEHDYVKWDESRAAAGIGVPQAPCLMAAQLITIH
jgi:hypothetical protein